MVGGLQKEPALAKLSLGRNTSAFQVLSTNNNLLTTQAVRPLTTQAAGSLTTQAAEPVKSMTVRTAAELTDAVSKVNVGTINTIDLQADITTSSVIEFTNYAATINGNGHTITSSSNRLLRIYKYNHGEVLLNNINFVSTSTGSDVRGIQVDGDNGDAKLTINGCSVESSTNPCQLLYAVYIRQSSVVDMTITNSTLTAQSAFFAQGNGGSVKITGSTLTGISNGAIVMADVNGTEKAKLYNVTLENTTLRSNTGTSIDNIIKFVGTVNDNNIMITGDGTQIIGKDGNVIPVDYTQGTNHIILPVYISYLQEKLVQLKPNTIYQITVDGRNFKIASDNLGKLPIEGISVDTPGESYKLFGKSISIVPPNDDGTYTSSNPLTLNIPNRPDAPSVTGVDATAAGNDGMITGCDTTMEYRLANGGNWADCTGAEITGLTAGDYEVRIKATESSFASLPSPAAIGGVGGSGGSGPGTTDPENPTPTPPGGGEGGSGGGGGAGGGAATSILAYYNGGTGKWQATLGDGENRIKPYGKCKDHPDGILGCTFQNGLLKLVWADKDGNISAIPCHVEHSTKLF